jgi:hypothetical protein
MSRESYEDYDRVVAHLNDRHRVILCKDGIQWILQRKMNKQDDGWRGLKFCRTKSGLLRFVGEAGDILPNAMAILEALPDWAEPRPTADKGSFSEDLGHPTA